ncbi:hypothetical protein M2375_000784 [Comamonas sp. BIGb0152]|uniref:M35 family metallo-endopeptidase n=1 Tax=Comamonas sp. BIGb0152 TaxID=2940601 RepID=UPI00216738E4|nr:M35 family metallo-endopeptidase [Comamonas sp. BIGb0152]MCS4292578.1 hypothetical protein [Comamonas sp. BIGb0152]
MVFFKIPGPIGTRPDEIARLTAGSGVSGDSFFKHQAPANPWNGELPDEREFPSPSRQPLAYKKSQTSVSQSVEEPWSDDTLTCFNVKSEEFGKMMMGLRDEAVTYAQNRRAELLRWDEKAKARTMKWFNSSEQEIRDYLLPRIDSIIRVLRELTPDSFDYDTAENNVDAGCLPGKGLGQEGVVASVCAADTKRHRILINMIFFEIPKRGMTYGTNTFNGKDSQLLSLIHEVTHFNDVAGSKDPYYGAGNALAHAKQPKARMNADSLASYILGMDITVPYQVEHV